VFFFSLLDQFSLFIGFLPFTQLEFDLLR